MSVELPNRGEQVVPEKMRFSTSLYTLGTRWANLSLLKHQSSANISVYFLGKLYLRQGSESVAHVCQSPACQLEEPPLEQPVRTF